MGELGFTGVDIPEKFGGLGLDKTTACIVIEVLSKGESASLMTTISAHTAIGTIPIIWYIFKSGARREIFFFIS